jgi:hypothetical protein
MGNLIQLGFVLIFFVLMLVFVMLARRKGRSKSRFREISAFTKLRRSVGLAVEAGQRLHISLGYGGVNGPRSASAFVGLSMLQRIARAASISDRPPVATSGESALAILSQDTLQNAFHMVGADRLYDPTAGQLSGLTPFSYVVGALPVIYDQQVSMNILAGHFGSEIALVADAAERSGSLSLGGSDNLSAQAVLFATAQEPLIGEELYAGGAYIQAGPMHTASLQAQDVLRWVLISVILVGSILRMLGVL